MSYSFLQQFSFYNFYLNLRNTSTNETWSVKTTKGKVIIAAKGSNELGMDEQIRITVEYGKRLGGGGRIDFDTIVVESKLGSLVEMQMMEE